MKNLIALALLFTIHAHASNREEISGSYMVPTLDISLLPYTTLEVKGVRVKKEGGNITLKYDFPQALAGTPIEIELFGVESADGSWQIYGAAGSLSCSLVDGFRACVAQYNGLTIDKSARDQYLASISKTPEELEKRVRVANLFSDGEKVEPIQALRIGMDGERIGVLRFKDPGLQ